MEAEITVFDSSAIRDQYKKNEHQLAVRAYDWNNADILDWFFSGERLGYPNISMWNDRQVRRAEQDGDDRIEDLGGADRQLQGLSRIRPVAVPVRADLPAGAERRATTRSG